MNQEVLSICIPTYNRHPYLKRLLDALLPEVKALNGAVGVYITDNASTDETQVLCQAYIESGLPLNYERNPENKGPDFNIAKAFNMGRGNFVWVLGDDEIVFKGALALLLELLSQKPDAMMCYLNPAAITSFLDGNAEISRVRMKSITSAEKMAGIMGVFVTFISAVVINKKLLMSKCGGVNSERYVGTNLVQLSWVLSALACGKSFIFVTSKVFAAEVNNSGGYKLFKVFGENLVNISKEMLKHSPGVHGRIVDSALFFLLDWRFNGKWVHMFEGEDCDSVLYKSFGDRLVFRLYVKPFLLTGKLRARLLHFFSRIVRKIIRIYAVI